MVNGSNIAVKYGYIVFLLKVCDNGIAFYYLYFFCKEVITTLSLFSFDHIV